MLRDSDKINKEKSFDATSENIDETELASLKRVLLLFLHM